MDFGQLEKEKYNSLIEKSIKKKYIDFIPSSTKFIKSMPKELSSDLKLIKSDDLPKTLEKERLLRIKYICEHSLLKISKQRKKDELDLNTTIKDHFSVYLNALKWAESLLKDF